MNIMASSRLSPDAAIEKIEGQLSEIRAIYRRLFPHHDRRFMLYEGDNPVWSAPSVIEGPLTMNPGLLSAEFIGQHLDPGAGPGCPEVTVTVSVPRAPTPQEVKGAEGSWTPPRFLAALFSLAPLIYEDIRYRAEMRRLRKMPQRHEMRALAAGIGLPALLPQEPAQSQRPAILIGMHWLEVGGAEKLAFDCVTWARAAGLRVFVVAGVPSLQRLAGRLPDDPDVQFIRLDRYLPQHLWPRYIANLVQDENIRLVHIHHCHLLYDCLPHLRASAPWVQVIDSTHIHEYANGGYPRLSGVWSNFINIHHVISRDLSQWYRDRFHTMGKLRLGRMLSRRDVDAPLPALNMTAGQKALHVTFIGRLYYQKRPIVVVEIFRALAKWAEGAGVALTGTMVGEGPFEMAVARLLQRYGLYCITMQPADSDIPALLSRSDILILPSSNEGLALVCYEAVEHGCIPISTDVGGQSEIVPKDLLVPLAPHAAVRSTRDVVARLWQDSAFLARQKDALHQAWRDLATDPTAEELMMQIYCAAASQVRDTISGPKE